MFDHESAKLPAPEKGPGTTSSAGAKFAIGVLAGGAAVLLPRLLALLAKGDDAPVVFFSPSYFALAGGIGVFLGLVMLVLEYQVPARPKETFMAALGLPAVLSGAIGTASTVESVSDLSRDAERLRQAMRQEQGIVKEGAFSALEPLGVPATPKPAGESSWLPLPFIGVAHAGGGAAAADPVRFGVRVEQPKYIVVLKQAANREQALQYERQLRVELPTARAVRSDKGYFVVLGGAPAGETDALLAAARARKVNAELRPVLVEVKN